MMGLVKTFLHQDLTSFNLTIVSEILASLTVKVEVK
jgi:hypothetical protein